MRRFPGWAPTALLAPSRQRSGESRLHIRYLPSYNKTIPHRAVSSNDKTSLNLGKRERMLNRWWNFCNTEQSPCENNDGASVRATGEVLNLKQTSRIC